MADLRGKVAVVTGASRGVGKGTDLGLGEAGATVYVTGRTEQEGQTAEELSGTIYETADAVTALGGRGIAVRCDHRDDAQVAAVFEQVAAEQDRLDLLVNNVWGGYERMVEDGQFTWHAPFWEQPIWRWDAMFAAGVRAHYVASSLAARSMVARRSGLIVNVSFFAGQKYLSNTAYGVAKAATDWMAAEMAHELRDHQVAALALYPGLVRTEAVLRAAEHFDLSNSESPQFLGRVVAALVADAAIMGRSGQVLVAAAVAQEYGIADIDGRYLRPLTLEEV